jgi:hypothetical protein
MAGRGGEGGRGAICPFKQKRRTAELVFLHSVIISEIPRGLDEGWPFGEVVGMILGLLQYWYV